MLKARKMKRQKPSLGQEIIGGLTELLDTIKRGEPLDKKFTVRHVTIDAPGIYSSKQIRQTRQKLGMSQKVFAMIVGVSVKLVEHWESGIRVPSPMARRLLDEINSNPQYWRQKLRAA